MTNDYVLSVEEIARAFVEMTGLYQVSGRVECRACGKIIHTPFHTITVVTLSRGFREHLCPECGGRAFDRILELLERRKVELLKMILLDGDEGASNDEE